ncbi:hypothetical protein [Euzebya tangerina]|uniref:hypothetical protein n=1 Tax=Euzebya tangerina TaxID=591198 RepID=UPI000E31E8E4|nr:hypothetical protein [Euzebya tangerina]
MSTTIDGPSARPTAAPDASRRTDIVTMVLGSWLLVGLFVDGWAHSNLNELETFFTPWHALFYSGFGATAGWIGWVVYRRQSQGIRGAAAVPRGYDLAILGLVIFGLGGVGDMIWHTIFGIETGLDALFSPTHLLLFAGILLILSTPLRRAWADSGTRWSSLRHFGPALASLTLVVAATMFMLMFLSPLNTDVSPEWLGEVSAFEADLYPVVAAAALIVTSAVLVASVVVTGRRWVLPRGAIPVMWTSVAVLAGAMEEYDEPEAVIALVAGGILVDVLVGRLQDRSGPRPRVLSNRQTWLLGVTIPLILWIPYYAVAGLRDGIGLEVEFWTGNIMWAAMSSGLLALVIAPPRSGPVSAEQPGVAERT